ncbi:DUF3618 domain-containing protein [Jannaschia formosa]|uniref:DUF3618 domain-containing protein n=1 Tax=Jannaschia formosa TaxID=2259592 RepID=UPI000E1C3C6E|nr:DUF3618 domain-containing protein [Jannaschia formosa]TFL19238.1 DUF3618 domain-containing protein [Jannaschia formosa]
MTHDPNKAHIEAEIAEERNALADSLSKLTSQLSPENLVNSVGETLKSQSDDLAQAVVRGAKENPAALALIGAGLGWLLLSKSTGKSSSSSAPARAPVGYPARAPVGYDATPRQPVGGLRHDTSEEARFKARVAAAEASLNQPHEADDHSMIDQAKRFIRKNASQMRASLYDGTSELSDLARERVVAARRKALMAQERTEHHRRAMQAKSTSFYYDNPLIVGAGAAALGAAVAMALPRTQMEDETFGAHRDALVDEADRVLHEELARAKRMAYAAMDEAEAMAQEAVDEMPSGEEAVAQAEAKAREAGERIKSRAQEAQDAKAH